MTPKLLALFFAGLLTLAAAAQNLQGVFTRKFDSAVKTSDKKGMEAAVRRYPGEAIVQFELVLDRYLAKGETAQGERLELLKTVFVEVWNSKLFTHIEDFRSNMDPIDRRVLNKLQIKSRQVDGLFKVAKRTRHDEDYKKYLEQIKQVIAGYEELGDNYAAAKQIEQLFYYSNKMPGESLEKLELVVSMGQKYRGLRKDIDWTRDKRFIVNENWLRGQARALKIAKEGGGLPGERRKKKAVKEQLIKNAEADLKAFAPGSKWHRVDMRISLQKKLEDGITSYASVNPLDWAPLNLTSSTSAKIYLFKDGDIYLQRIGANKFQAILGEEGKGGKPQILKIGMKPKPVYLHYMKADEDGEQQIVEYGFFLWLGGQGVTHMGQTFNLSPTWGKNRKDATIRLRSASVLHAEVNGIEIALYDENFNGLVGEDWQKAGALNDYRLGAGVDEPAAHPALDSMRVGKSKALQPFSKYAMIGEKWYSLRVLGNNETLNYRELDMTKVPTGHVQMKWVGPSKAKPDYLVIVGTGLLHGSAFDIAHTARGGLEVPAGEYIIRYGRIINGKVPKFQNAVILGGDAKPFRVEHGKLFTLELGAPFHLQFDMEQEDNMIMVDSSKFWVKGRYGEKYCAIGSEILEPELVWSKKYDGAKARVLGRWERCKDNVEVELIRKTYSGKSILELLYMPLPDVKDKTGSFVLEVKKPVKSGPFFIGLRQKKHKLFGKLLAEFK